MKTPKIVYACSHCDAQYPKWQGQCRECGQWGTVKEGQTSIVNSRLVTLPADALIDVAHIGKSSAELLPTGIGELDRVLGGGIVKGSLVLLGGEPGIGKSTLVLQLCDAVHAPAIYVSGEESPHQIKSRIDRLGLRCDRLRFLPEHGIETMCAYIEQEKPALVVIDSIQTMYSAQLPSEAGSVHQVRVGTVRLLETAKRMNIPIIIIGHVTKDGTVAGPKTLEHLVDTVLYLETSAGDDYRILRGSKNRFGSTAEIGIFEMTGSGLRPASNPSELFLSDRTAPLSGTATTCIMEGTRPFLVELQALVSKTSFGYPQRRSSGFDQNRLQMLTAVLAKKAGIPLTDQDIYLNVTGGLRIVEPAADLAACLAMVASHKNTVIPRTTLVIGEVGLSGEVRPVPQIDRRIDEARKLGFTSIIAPAGKQPIKNLSEAIEKMLNP